MREKLLMGAVVEVERDGTMIWPIDERDTVSRAKRPRKGRTDGTTQSE